MSTEEFQKILLNKGMVKLYKIKYNKFKSNQNVEKNMLKNIYELLIQQKK